MNEVIDPRINPAPTNNKAIPRYIGLREILKGPFRISVDGFSKGLTVVFTFLNS
jgi:hypothetical protein